MVSQVDLPDLNVTTLLKAYGLSPKKGLGQNFLARASTLKRIVECAEMPAGASVLEVGAGLGSLTRYLAQAARRVVAVELDGNLIPILRQVLSPWDNIEIIQGDILSYDPVDLMGEAGYFVVANIPYFITSALIRHLLEATLKPARLVLTVQGEVAERICADSGKRSLLALSVQVYGKARLMLRIPAKAFYPAPRVDSAVVRVDLYPQPAIPLEWLDSFFLLAKAGFSQKRKTLRNALIAGLGQQPAAVLNLLNNCGIDPQRRAETLNLEEWRALTEQFIKAS